MYSDEQKKIDIGLKRIPENTWKDFHKLLNVQSNSKNELRMALYMYERIKEIPGCIQKIDKHGNIIVTKGAAKKYPCIVAHLDTVHAFYENYKIFYVPVETSCHARAQAGSGRVGVGGDDKCGLYACLYMLHRFKNIKVVLFTSEEVGLIGSSDIELEEFDDVGYIIQLDRWGRSDFIAEQWNSETVSPGFKLVANPIMEKYGYFYEEGLITDSINLFNRDVGVSCVNISCGYYQHHSNMEFIDLNEFYNSLLFTHELMKALGENEYKALAKPNRALYRWEDDYDEYDGMGHLNNGWSYNTNKYYGNNTTKSTYKHTKWDDDNYEKFKKTYQQAEAANFVGWTYNKTNGLWEKDKLSLPSKEDPYDVADEVEDARIEYIIENYEWIKDHLVAECNSNNINIAHISQVQKEFIMEELAMSGFKLKLAEINDMIDEILDEYAEEKEREIDYKRTKSLQGIDKDDIVM